MIKGEHFTVTESKVAELVFKGYTNKLIAKELNISEHTVKSHLENMYLKLGIHNRVQLAVLYMQDKVDTDSCSVNAD